MLGLSVAIAVLTAAPPPEPRPLLGFDLISREPVRGDAAAPLVNAQPISRREVDRVEAAKLLAAGRSLEFRRKLPAAYETFEAALRLDPENLELLKRLIVVGQLMGRTEDVLRHAREVLARRPDDPELLFGYTNECIRRGDIRGAREVIQRALEIPDLRRRNPELWLEGHRHALNWSMLLADFAVAAEHGRKLVEVISDPVAAGVDPERVRRILREPATGFGQTARGQPSVFEQTAQALRAINRLKEAAELFERGMRTEPGGERLRVPLAETLTELGEHARAFAELTRARESNRSDPRLAPLLVRLLRKLGREREILPTLNGWRAEDRSNASISLTYAEQLIERKDHEAARRVLIDTRDSPMRSAMLARLFREMNDPEALYDTLVRGIRLQIQAGSVEARASLDAQIKAIGANPELVRRLAPVARKKVTAGDPQERILGAMTVGQLAMAIGDAALAIEMVDLAVAVNGGVDLYQSQGLLSFLLRREKHAELIRICDRLLEVDGGDLDAIEMKALALSGLGRHDEAGKEIERALAKANDVRTRILLRLTRATLLHNRKNLDHAVEECRALLAQFPEAEEVSWIRYRMSFLLSEKGEFDKAEQELLKLIDAGRGPNGQRNRIWAAANNDLGYQWVDRGVNIERGTAMIQEALKIDPDNGSYLDSLGWAYFKQKNYEEAARYLRRAIEADDNEEDPVPVDHLGDVLLQLGRTDEAIAHWEKAVKFHRMSKSRDPDGSKAKQIEKKIYLHRQRGEAK